MSEYGKKNFGSGMEVNAQVVNGKCPHCTVDGVFISLNNSIPAVISFVTGTRWYIPSVNIIRSITFRRVS